MNESRAAIRYAKALLSLSVDQKSTAAIETDMKSVFATITNSQELQELLVSPVVKAEDKKRALEQIFKDTQESTLKLIGVLITNKRIDLLAQIASKYITLSEELRGEQVAEVTTAVPLTADLEKKVLAKIAELTGKKVSLQKKVDAAVLGGFVLRVGDLQYDASIANKLAGLKRNFINSI